MFEGFTRKLIDTRGYEPRRGGSGPPLLLLHGYPQSHVMWHRIAPALVQEFTVVCPDAPSWRLWGGQGLVGRTYDVLEVWRAWADDVEQPIEGGHFLPEEAPEETLKAVRSFLMNS